MANYFTLNYESTAASSPGYVELNYGSSTSDGLTVQAALYAGSDFTPTHYKMWGVELTQGEGVVTISGAEWLPFVETRTVRLARHNDPQYAYVMFKDATETETETFTSNSVTFGFVEPIIHGSTTWKQDFEELGFNSASSNILRNASYKTEVELNKSKLDQLEFSNRNFSGLRIEPNAITIVSTSELGQLIGLDELSYVTISKVFETSATPMITVDYGSGFDTLTAYDQEIRTTQSGVNAGRISNVVWNSETKTLSFDAYRFSTYGFCTIQKVEFTADSGGGAYTGNSNIMKVYVQDSNGEPVENAPVTLSGSGDNLGSIAESMPVLTSSSGIAEFTLNVTSPGVAVFEANVDGLHFSDPDLTVVGIEYNSATGRSLLTQYEQIRRSATYDDDIADVNTEAVAEPSTPTVSGSSTSVLEHDLNVIRTLMKQLKGTTNWYDALPTYENPEDTNNDITVTLSGIAGNTLDAKTILLAVNDANSGSGFSITPGDGGFLFDNTVAYATLTDRRGLPIFHSTTNSGSYYDEGGADDVVTIDVLDMSNNSEFRDTNGDLIFAKFHDAADYSGTGSGTDVYVKFYTDAGPYTFTADDPTSIRIVYPYRKIMNAVLEHEWTRTDFVSSWEGDEVLVNKIVDLWSFVGTTDGTEIPDWTVISGSPMVSSDETDLVEAIQAINDEFGDRIYTEHNYITNGDSFTDSLDDLDIAISTLSDSLDAGANDKHIEIVAEDIAAGTAHQLPVGLTYTPKSDAGQQGGNMDVYLDGQLLSASTGVLGANEDKDYSETSSTHITFHFDVYQYSNITYQVRQ